MCRDRSPRQVFVIQLNETIIYETFGPENVLATLKDEGVFSARFREPLGNEVTMEIRRFVAQPLKKRQHRFAMGEE
jgi:hypothetical protein